MLFITQKIRKTQKKDFMNEILIRLIRLNSLFLKFVLFVSLDVQKNFQHRKTRKKRMSAPIYFFSHRNHRKRKKDFMNEILIRLIRLNSLFLKLVIS